MNQIIASFFSKRVVIIASIILVGWSFDPVLAEEVSTDPPPIYREKLAALLTPLDKVLHGKASTKQGDETGATLLEEDVHYIDEKGRRYVAWHRVSKAFDDSGVKEIAESTFGYRKSSSKLHLVLAQTILPDGKKLAVQPSAAILQTPQRQADYSLYDDQGELRLIFPNVKPGSVTESIVVLEENQFRIPNEFTCSYSWAFGWPLQKMHLVVEAPRALADRLRMVTIGSGVPEVEKSEPSKERERFSWTAENVAPLPNEWNVPPTRQNGPALFVSSLADWDAFVRWYSPLVEARSVIKPALAAKIDEWTKSARSPREILDIIMARVSSDVRYVGLEFGACDFQPHDCNDVWENQYGDCKDKANLLRAMLRYKGINAYITLLNTENKGRVEKRSPGANQFNHAILAVELEPGHYIFCDPTITYAKSGGLSPNDADRDVLLVKNGAAEWSHTPPQDAGMIRYDFDLKLSADGALSGWLTQESTGYYALAYADDYARLDKVQLRRRAHDLVQGFFRSGEVVDVTATPLEKWDGPYQMKTYFLVPAVSRDKQDQRTLAFPQSGVLFSDLGSQKKRQTPWYLWADKVKVSARIKLPDGLAPADLPKPYDLKSAPLDANARWEVKDGVCLASLELATKQNFVAPDQFEIMYNALLSVHAWLDTPIALAASGGAQPGPDKENALENFPMMPSGDGQLELVDQLYPENGDANLRREALRKVMQYFPGDKTTVFTAKMELAVIDWHENKFKEAADQFRKLLQDYRASVTPENAAWCEYNLAFTLRDLKQTDAALKIFEKLAGDTRLSKRRRAWSDYQCATILQEKSRAAAIKLLRAGLASDTDAQPSEFTLLAKLLILNGQSDDLKKEISRMVTKKPPQFAEMLTRLAQSAGDLLPLQKSAELARLMRMLEDAGKTADLGKDFYDGLETSRNSIRSVANVSRIRESLKKYLAKNPLPPLDAAAAQFKTRTDFNRAISDAENNRKPELCLRYSMELLTHFEPDIDFPSYLWKAANNADWNERFHEKSEPLLPELLDLCDQLPPDNDNYFDGRLLRARGCARKGDIEGARKIHEEVLKNPRIPPGFKVVVHARLAENLEALHDYPKALEIYRLMESELEYARTKDALLRAAFLNLNIGKRDEALRLLALIRGRGTDAIKQASTSYQILEMVALAKDSQNATAYWDGSEKWWPSWLALEKKLGMKPLDDVQLVPAYPDQYNLYNDMDAEAKANDRKAFFGDLRLLAWGARWEPALAIEFAGMVSYNTANLMPELANDLKQFTITMCDNFVTNDPDLLRKNQYFEAACCIDCSQDDKGFEMIHEYSRKDWPNDSYSQCMWRVWGIAAKRRKEEIQPAIHALEGNLSASSHISDRWRTVTLLADLYRLSGRVDDEEKLLKREMENADIKSSNEALETITARYKKVAAEGEETRRFSKAVDQWLAKRKPAWFDFAEPKSLDDPRLSNLENVLKNPDRIFSAPEIVKLNLLVAASPSQPADRRENAFLNGLIWLVDCAQTKKDTTEVFGPLIDDEELPEGVRIDALWWAIYMARYDEMAGDFEKLRSQPLYQKFNDRSKTACELFHDALAVDRNSADSITEFCGRLLQKEITTNSLLELRLAYERLLQLDPDGGAAEKVYQQLPNVNLGSDVQIGRTALQLEFLKSKSRAKAWAPFAEAMRQVIFARFPEDSIKEPAVFATLHNRERFQSIDQDTALQIRLFKIKTKQLDTSDFGFWYSFIRDLKVTEANQKLGMDLIAAALQNAPDDMERSRVISGAYEAIDLDNDKLRERLEKLLDPYRNTEKFPNSYGMMRMFGIKYAWRLGQPINVESDFSKLQHPMAKEFADRVKLEYYLQTRNIPLLKNTLQAINPDSLLSESLLPLSLRSFELAGMNDELALAKEAAKKAIYRSVILSWAMPDTYYSPGSAFALARLIHDPSGFPADWLSYLASRMHNHRENLFTFTEEAYMREDWARLLEATNSGIEEYPNYYHLYWEKAVALYHLGRKKEAVDPLQVYVRYSKNETDYPQAMEWLKEIQPPVKQ